MYVSKAPFAFLLLCLGTALPALAQRPGGSGQAPPAIGKVQGKVLDAATRKPAEFATVAVYALRNDSLVGGTIVRPNGDFSVEKLPLGPLRVEVSFIGYQTIRQEVMLNRQQAEKDLGNLMLEPGETLQEVEITGRSSQVVMKVDRRVFNVERDLSTRGGTGVDVMKNVPGLNVDVEGNVELRGSSPQILVDGRPSALTLEQIPAEDIERVEVITNPSVVFDASATGGIINVVLKKNTKPGYFGQVQGGVGSNDRYQVSGNLNVKEGRTAFNIGLNYNTSRNVTDGRTDRSDLDNGEVLSVFRQVAENDSYWTMYGGRFAVEHDLSNRNTISANTNVMVREMGGTENQVFSTVTGNGEPLSRGDQFNESDNRNLSANTQVMFRRKSPKAGKEWTMDLNHSYWQRNSVSSFTTRGYNTDGDQLAWSPRRQENFGGAGYNRWRMQFDAVDPVSDDVRIEWGAMASYTLDNTWLYVFQTSPLIGESVADTNQSNNYLITDIVNAAYFNYARKLNERWSMQAGLRLEQTWFDAELLGRGISLGYRYPDGLADLDKTFFPALYLVRRWEGTTREFQVNFSRKIRRPRFWQIMPFIQIADSRNIRIGNPALAPELVNMAEINHLLPLQNGKGSWLSSLYGRYVEDIISQVAFPLESDPDILVNSWDNGRNAFEYGWENTLRVEPMEKLVTTLSGTLEWVTVELGGRTPARNSGINWDAKLIVSYELPKQWMLQVNGEYRGPNIIPQGTRISNYGVDASIAKDINKRLNVVLAVNDVFFTRRWGHAYDTPTFRQDDFRRREMRFVRFTATWKFGERDASLFRRRPAQRMEPSLRGGGGPEE
jgi:hypothetical protein